MGHRPFLCHDRGELLLMFLRAYAPVFCFVTHCLVLAVAPPPPPPQASSALDASLAATLSGIEQTLAAVVQR